MCVPLLIQIKIILMTQRSPPLLERGMSDLFFWNSVLQQKKKFKLTTLISDLIYTYQMHLALSIVFS